MSRLYLGLVVMRRLRVYSEMAAYSAATAPAAMKALAERSLELVLAVRPWDLGRVADAVARLRDAGVTVSLWPMLADHDGRFLHVGNVARFGALALSALDACEAHAAPIRDMLLDLEPPIEVLRAALRGELWGAARTARRGMRMQKSAAHAVAVLQTAIERRGVSTTAAVVPTALWDGTRKGDVSSALGTVGIAGFARVDVMAYSSLFQGLSLGMLDRADALALLSVVATKAASIAGRSDSPAARIALGCVGIGALGDERVYTSAAELAEDVAVVRAAGIDDLALLDLGGVLARPPFESWLDAFATTEASTAALPTSFRARALVRALEVATGAAAAGARSDNAR